MVFEIDRNLPEIEKEIIFHEFIVGEYLRYGSVDQVYVNHMYDLPVSVSGFYHVLNRWGIVKAVGRSNSRFAEVLGFLSDLVEENIPLETLYKRLSPLLQTSMSTMHRVLGHVKEGVMRRVGTALVVTPDGDDNLVLVGNDVSTQRPELGKRYGDVSLPMGFSSRRDSVDSRVRRVLQQEVFTQLTIKRKFPDEVFSTDLHPIMYVDIADVSVAVFHLPIPVHLIQDLSSFKLEDLRFERLADLHAGLIDGNLRAGVQDIASGFGEHQMLLQRERLMEPLQVTSRLNRRLAHYALQYSS